MDFEVLGRVITGVLTVTTLVAAALIGLMVGSLRTLRDSNGDLRARVEDLEKERTEDEAKIARAEAKASEALAENKLLTSMVQGRVDWTAIQDQLEEHHRQAIVYWGKTGDDLHAIRAALEGKP